MPNIPDRIKIKREKGYHTDRIGRFGGRVKGGQFMGFVVASLPTGPLPKDGPMHKRWHAVLHRFDLAGVHQETKHFCAGVSADGEDKVIRSALKVLSEWLMDLRSIKYGDISVGLFKTEIDGRLFGLVDTSAPDEGIIQVTLWPNDLAFYPPWDGSYDT